MEKLCYNCKSKNFENISNDISEMSCHHSLCINCLLYLIFSNHIQEIKSEKLKVKCKCNEGYKEINLETILNLIHIKYTLDNEQKYDKNICLKHNEEIIYFCKKCDESICKQCSENEHMNHKIIDYFEYVEKYKHFLKGLPYLNSNIKDFLKNFDDLIQKFKNETDKKINNTIKIIDDLIEFLVLYKSEFCKQFQIKLSLNSKILKILKLLYSIFYIDLGKIEECNDIFLLKNMKNISLEISDIKFINDEEFSNNLNELNKYSKLLKPQIKNILNYQIDFKEINREFSCVDKLIGHTSLVNHCIQLKDKKILSGSDDYSMKFWEIDKTNDYKYSECNYIENTFGKVKWILQLKDERLLSSTSSNKNTSTIRIWEKNKDKYSCINTFSKHKEYVTKIIQLPDERLVTCSKGNDYNLILWEKYN